MRTTTLRARIGLSVLIFGVARGAAADPVAFVVNEDSHSVSVVDVVGRLARAHVSTWDGFEPIAGTNPTDAVYDAASGRVFVAARERLVSFDGRMGDGRDFFTLSSADEASGLALFESGRRLFMSHEAQSGAADGIVSEFAINDPNAPQFLRQHAVVGVPDLRFIAYDARHHRIYVVDDGGAIARTGTGNRTFVRLTSGGAPNPGGILAAPDGGVWLTSRTPAKLHRVYESGGRREWLMPDAQHPRGLAFDPEVPGALLIAVDDRARIRRFVPSTGAFSDVMVTEARPQDVATAPSGAIVSANRIGPSVIGSVTASGQTIAATQLKSVALALGDVPRLTPDPSAHGFCYNALGDRDEKTFLVRNTRVNRQQLDLGSLQLGGANPANYAVLSNGCSAGRLGWGESCAFRLRFTANGPSVEPPPPFGPRPATWPAEARIASTDGSALAVIALRALQQLERCPYQPPALPVPR